MLLQRKVFVPMLCLIIKQIVIAETVKIDKYLTNRFTGIPIMIALLALIFWITISGANYPSQMLSEGLFLGAGPADRFLYVDACT